MPVRDQAARIYKRFIEFIGLCVPKPEIAQIGRGQLQKQEVILFGVFTSFPSVLYITYFLLNSGFLNCTYRAMAHLINLAVDLTTKSTEVCKESQSN